MSGVTFILLLFSVTTNAAEDAISQTVQSSIAPVATDNGWAINYPKQRKLFVMQDWLWVFFSDGKDAVYCTSPDGAHWSKPTIFIPDVEFGHRFGCWFDGDYFHYALCTADLGHDVSYRRGKPMNDATIAWCTAEQIAYDTPDNKNVMYPKVIVDSKGYPWIAFMELIYQVPNAPPYDAVVTKSSENDGTWTTSPDFPFKLVEQKPVAGYPDPVGVPLTGGKTFWIYNTHENGDDIFAARIWDGEVWQTQESVVQNAPRYAFFNAVAEKDTVHLVHGAGEIYYQQRDKTSLWSDPIKVAGSAFGHTSISLIGNNETRITWLDTSRNIVCYRDAGPTGLGLKTDWINEAGQRFAGSGINLNTLTNSSGEIKHGAVYTVEDGPAFQLRSAIDFLDIPTN